MELDIKEIAHRIQSLREDSEFTPEEMADAIGVTVDYYIEHEKGEKDFSFTFL